MALVGIALIDRLTVGRERGVRFRRGMLFGLGWLGPGMAWMVYLTAPGYVIATVVFAAYVGGAFALAPTGRWRLLALPCALLLTETIRWSFPFQGVPLASLAIGQVAGPLAPVARVGGALLLSGVTMALGVALGELSRRRDVRRPLLAVATVATVVLLAVAGVVAPRAEATGTTLRIAAVQGGGKQGTRAVDTNPRDVFERHLAATALIRDRVDLIVWPENVVNVDGRFVDSAEFAELSALAKSLQTPMAVGVVEDVAPGRFVNTQVLIGANGLELARYDKVRRVPFGEYMPFRSTLEALGAPTNLVPKDAVAGRGPAVLDSPAGTLGVVISWEVFFAGRAREAVRNGALVMLNPTNGSSYRGTILQTQQVASSRLRAIETDRWVVQNAPTGLSAFVSPNGKVIDRTGVSEQALIEHTVALRSGRSLTVRLGDKAITALAAMLLLIATVTSDRSRRRASTAAASVVTTDTDPPFATTDRAAP